MTKDVAVPVIDTEEFKLSNYNELLKIIRSENTSEDIAKQILEYGINKMNAAAGDREYYYEYSIELFIIIQSEEYINYVIEQYKAESQVFKQDFMAFLQICSAMANRENQNYQSLINDLYESFCKSPEDNYLLSLRLLKYILKQTEEKEVKIRYLNDILDLKSNMSEKRILIFRSNLLFMKFKLLEDDVMEAMKILKLAISNLVNISDDADALEQIGYCYLSLSMLMDDTELALDNFENAFEAFEACLAVDPARVSVQYELQQMEEAYFGEDEDVLAA